ncbi:MAG: P63C domain-containing protein [Syntrophales bacterium]
MGKEPMGKAKGGLARAAKLTPEERSCIAKKAATARWERGEPILKATYSGILKIADIEIPCHVLENGERILSTRGVMKSLGRTWRGRKYTGTEMPVFLEAKNLTPYISDDLRLVLAPRYFRPKTGHESEGYKAEILPLVCDVYLRANDDKDVLTKSQEEVAKRCEILTRSLSKVGIIALVDEATGYQEVRPKDALQAYLEIIIRKELAAWAKKFPDEFYENIYKLKNWPWPGMQKNRFSVVAHYTRDLVYERIAPELLERLESKTPKDEKGRRKNKFHQWLTEDVGDPMLAQHLHSLIMFQRLALSNGYGWNRFVKMVDKVLPRKGQTLEMPFPEPGMDL